MAFYNLNKLFIKKQNQPNSTNISILPSKSIAFLNLTLTSQLTKNELAKTIKNLAFEELSLDPFEQYQILYEPNTFRSDDLDYTTFNVFVACKNIINASFENLSNSNTDYAFFAPIVFETLFPSESLPNNEKVALLNKSKSDSFVAVYICGQLQLLRPVSPTASIDMISIIINEFSNELNIEQFDTLLAIGDYDEGELASLAQNLDTKLLTEADLNLNRHIDKSDIATELAYANILRLQRFNFSTKQKLPSIHKTRVGQLSLVCAASLLLFFVYPLTTFEYQKQKLVAEIAIFANTKSDYEATLMAMAKKSEELSKLEAQINQLQDEINSQTSAVSELDRIAKDGGGQVGFLVFLAKTAQEFELKLDELCITKLSGVIKTSATKHGEITKYNDTLAHKGIDITIDKLQKDSHTQFYTASLELVR